MSLATPAPLLACDDPVSLSGNGSAIVCGAIALEELWLYTQCVRRLVHTRQKLQLEQEGRGQEKEEEVGKGERWRTAMTRVCYTTKRVGLQR